MKFKNATREYFDGAYSKYWVWIDGHAFKAKSLLSAVRLARTRHHAVIQNDVGDNVAEYVRGSRLR